MTKSDAAVACFRQGFSCSQAILSAFAEDLGLDRETALRLSQPFGGGIARRADWCGALTGAFLAVGLKYGRTKVEDAASRDRTYTLVNELVARFEAGHGAVKCRDLLGCDIGTPAGQKEADDKNLHRTICDELVRDAAALLEKIL